MDNIKRLFCGMVATVLFLGSFSLGAWQGRAVPVSFNARTGEWNVLLAFDNSTQMWGDFNADASRYQGRAQFAAQAALASGTNNVYSNVDMARGPWFRSPSGDIVHVVRVSFIPPVNLFATARTQQKGDFAWVPVRTLMTLALGQGLGLSRAHARNLVDPSFLDPFKSNWQNMVAQLGQAGAPPTPHMPVPMPATQQAVPMPAAQQDWFRIPARYAIYFYNRGQPYYEFTNFYEQPVHIDGKLWPTTEHYFQAMKFPQNVALQESIRNAKTSRDAFNIAGQNQRLIPADWHTSRKFAVMYKALRMKFQPNSTLAGMLLGTGNKILVENAGVSDAEWGAGQYGQGNNHLGRMLMFVRQELRDRCHYEYDPTQSYSFGDLSAIGFTF